MQLKFISLAGKVYLIEASTNLVQWTKLAVRTNLTGAAEFVDAAPGTFSQRYYRVLVP